MNNKQIQNAFIAAKQYLSTSIKDVGKFSYICHAINYAYQSYDISDRVRNQSLKIIEERLDGCATITEWIHKNHLGIVKKIDMQDYRHAWLDSLIKEYGKKK